jgi:hypothetical protein
MRRKMDRFGFDMTTEIPLSRGLFATVDASDAPSLMEKKWYAATVRGCTYAMRTVGRRSVTMHSEIMASPKALVDHRDGNGLNNRRSNLRLANHSQNGGNSKRRRDNTSLLKGVTWNRRAGKWQAQIAGQYIGLFTDKLEAARAYDNAARARWQEFAKLNL